MGDHGFVYVKVDCITGELAVGSGERPPDGYEIVVAAATSSLASYEGRIGDAGMSDADIRDALGGYRNGFPCFEGERSLVVVYRADDSLHARSEDIYETWWASSWDEDDPEGAAVCAFAVSKRDSTEFLKSAIESLERVDHRASPTQVVAELGGAVFGRDASGERDP